MSTVRSSSRNHASNDCHSLANRSSSGSRSARWRCWGSACCWPTQVTWLGQWSRVDNGRAPCTAKRRPASLQQSTTGDTPAPWRRPATQAPALPRPSAGNEVRSQRRPLIAAQRCEHQPPPIFETSNGLPDGFSSSTRFLPRAHSRLIEHREVRRRHQIGPPTPPAARRSRPAAAPTSRTSRTTWCSSPSKRHRQLLTLFGGCEDSGRCGDCGEVQGLPVSDEVIGHVVVAITVCAEPARR